MKKICYVVTTPLTIKAFFIPQLHFLAEKGFDVTVICSYDEYLQIELGEKINYIPIGIPRGVSIHKSLKAIKQLIDVFKENKFDLIQYSTPNAALYSSIAAKKANCRIRNYHLMGFRYLGAKGIGKYILKKIEKISCKNSTSIECVSFSNMKLGLNEKIFEKEKATVVWNGSSGGVDLRRFDYSQRTKWREDIRKDLGYSEEDFIYGFVGRITRDKGINELLKAFSNLKDDSKLLLVGNIDSWHGLDHKLLNAAHNNNNKIRFHSSVKNIEKYFAAIDVLILASYREGFGNVVIEAAALGTPSIVTYIPGPQDSVLDGKTGLFVKAKKTSELENAMREIRKKDYRKMGKEAYLFVKSQFASDILCEKVLQRKENLLKKDEEGFYDKAIS